MTLFFFRLGRGQFQALMGMFRQKTNLSWSNIKYCVFDSPGLNLPFEQRIDVLKKVQFPDHVILTEMKQCTGVPHLYEVYESIVNEGGEGIILRKPNSFYEPGLSETFLLVKQFTDVEVKVIDLNIKNFGLLCEQKNGLTCIVKCSAQTYLHPPKPGSVITVKHQGIWKSGKLKYPHFLKERKELSWNDVLHAQQ